MALSLQNIELDKPTSGIFHATPWEYSSPLELGKRKVTVGFRSVDVVKSVSLEITKETSILKRGERKEYIIKVLTPDVHMSEVSALPPYRLDIERCSPTELVLYRIKKPVQQDEEKGSADKERDL